MTILGQQIAAAARSYVGTRYGDQGRMPGTMLDCIGVPMCAAWDAGIKPRDFDIRGYCRTATPSSIHDECARWMSPVPRDQLRAGDVVVVRFRDGDPQHIGVCYDHPHGGLGWVHADSLRGHVVEQRLVFTPYMRFVEAWRMPGA